jgi:hypothetical protein
MQKYLFFLTLLALSFNGVADTVRTMNARKAVANQEHRSCLPNLNIEAGCREVAKKDLDKTTHYPG